MKYPETILQTPNYTKYQVIHPRGVVFHHSSGWYAGDVSWCMNPVSKVSYHCVIAQDGQRTVLAKGNQRAWHAGNSQFKGRRDCNSFMLGCSFTGDTVTGEKRDSRMLTPEELESALEWLILRYLHHKMTFDWLTDHRTVSPGRKNDLAPDVLQQLLDYLKPRL